MKPAVLFLTAAAPLCVTAQPFSGPVEGFLFDPPTASIRPILGRPGSAYLGKAEVAGLTFASVAPQGSHGLAIREGRLILVSGLGAESRTEVDLLAVESVPDGAAWSADGRVAVIFSREPGWLRVLQDLPESPRLGETVTVGGERIRRLATDGKSVLVLPEHGSGLIRLDLQGERMPAPAPEGLVAIAVAGAGVAYAANREGAIFAIHYESQRAEERTGGAGPVEDLALLENGAHPPLLAVLGGGRLTLFDTATWRVAGSEALESAASSFERLRAGTVVLGVRLEAGEPVWIASPEGVRFVPAPALDSVSEVPVP